MALHLILITCGWAPPHPPNVRRPTVARAPLPLACASSSSREPAEAQAAFERWMDASCPPGAVPRNYSTAPGVGVQTMEGALAATWHAVCLSLCQPGDVPSLSVVLLPLVKAVASEAGMVALQRHLRSCRDCCSGFGKRLELQTLHPSSDAPGRASPVPALTLSMGPPLRLGGDGEEVEGAEEAELEEAVREAELEEARRVLERLILVESDASDSAEESSP